MTNFNQILLIDNDLLLMDTLEMVLEAEGFAARVFGSSPKALNYLEGQKEAQQPMPDLILCDQIMPEMTGLELFELLKADHQLGYLPFILLTGDVSKKASKDELGLDGVVIKPFHLSELLDEVNRVLHQAVGFHEASACIV